MLYEPVNVKIFGRAPGLSVRPWKSVVYPCGAVVSNSQSIVYNLITSSGTIAMLALMPATCSTLYGPGL